MTALNKTVRRARSLRQNSTSAERSAWDVLRKFRHYGFPVRRQHPIKGLVVDFAIPKAMLVIEVDGGIHDWDIVREKDLEREQHIKCHGWKVLRISNDVAFDLDGLFKLISDTLGI